VSTPRQAVACRRPAWWPAGTGDGYAN
jgi:hypothetical protein